MGTLLAGAEVGDEIPSAGDQRAKLSVRADGRLERLTAKRGPNAKDRFPHRQRHRDRLCPRLRAATRRPFARVRLSTQSQCEVCAVSERDVERAVCDWL